MGFLKDKVVLITGAGKNAARKTAFMMAEEGAIVAAADKDEDALRSLMDAIGDNGIPFVGDLADVSVCENIAKTVAADYGRIDVLFCGIDKHGDMIHDINHIPYEEVEEIWKANTFTTWNMVHAVVPYMVKENKGSIILYGSSFAYFCGNTSYGPAKAANIAMAAGIANEYGRYGIRCNSVSPYITYEYIEDHKDNPYYIDLTAEAEDFVPLYRLVDDTDISNAVLFLASDRSRGITGQDVTVDAGLIKGSMVNKAPKRG